MTTRQQDTLYLRIAEKIDEGPLTAPKAGGKFSQAFIKYLKLLYTPEEAHLIQHLRMGTKLTSAADIARTAGKSEEEVNNTLEPLAKKGHIIGFGENYAIPTIPLLVNIHQFQEKMGNDDLKAAELYQQFFIKEGYYKYYESSEKGTQITRVIPVRRALEHGQRILDTEEAHKIIEAVDQIALVPCPCRTRTMKMEARECREKNPVGYCIMVEASALYFEAVGLGKKVAAAEAKKYFDEMQDLGLVGTTDNYEDKSHTVICLCCECCCSQLRGRTRWDNPLAVSPSNFVAEANEECVLCGTCEDRCFFGAVSLDEELGRAIIDPEKCMGCGVCTITCDQEALRLKRVERSHPLPTSRDLFKKVAIENRGG